VAGGSNGSAERVGRGWWWHYWQRFGSGE